jgi:hypothetical protein
VLAFAFERHTKAALTFAQTILRRRVEVIDTRINSGMNDVGGLGFGYIAEFIADGGAPNPSRDTCQPVRPNVLYCIPSSFRLDGYESIGRRGAGHATA